MPPKRDPKKLDDLIRDLNSTARLSLPCTIVGFKIVDQPSSHTMPNGAIEVLERKVYKIGVRLPDGSIVTVPLSSADTQAFRENLLDEPSMAALTEQVEARNRPSS